MKSLLANRTSRSTSTASAQQALPTSEVQANLYAPGPVIQRDHDPDDLDPDNIEKISDDLKA